MTHTGAAVIFNQFCQLMTIFASLVLLFFHRDNGVNGRFNVWQNQYNIVSKIKKKKDKKKKKTSMSHSWLLNWCTALSLSLTEGQQSIVHVLVQLCPTLCYCMNYSLLGSYVYGTFHCIGRPTLYHWANWEKHSRVWWPPTGAISYYYFY